MVWGRNAGAGVCRGTGLVGDDAADGGGREESRRPCRRINGAPVDGWLNAEIGLRTAGLARVRCPVPAAAPGGRGR